MSRIELYSIIGVAIYYGWITNHCMSYNNRTMNIISWAIPIFIPIFGCWRNNRYRLSMKRITEYLTKIEREFKELGYPLGPECGWETHLRNLHHERVLRSAIFVIFWITLSVAILGIAIAGVFLQYPACNR